MTDKNGTLNVTGIGKVQVAPDEAVIQLSVMTDGKTAAEATASNARRTQGVVDAVSSQPNHGVTTSGLSVGPIISYDPNTYAGTIVGFPGHERPRGQGQDRLCGPDLRCGHRGQRQPEQRHHLPHPERGSASRRHTRRPRS